MYVNLEDWHLRMETDHLHTFERQIFSFFDHVIYISHTTLQENKEFVSYIHFVICFYI